MTANSTESAGFLLISDVDDAPRRACVERFAQAGLDLNIVPDVYTALARLVLGEPIRQVLLDVRSVDDVEMAFIRLVDRYAPSTTLFIPNLEGTTRRLQRYGEDIRATELDSIVAFAKDAARVATPVPLAPTATIASPSSPPAVESSREVVEAVSDAPPATRPLSTDGGPEAAEAGPSLHEAVRMRMSQGAAASVRRGPPGAAKGGAVRGRAATAKPTSNSNDAALTPQELEALLQQGPEEAHRQGAPAATGPITEGHTT